MNMPAQINPERSEPNRDRKRALVLSAGGPLGAAWEIGLLAGVNAAGVSLSGVDRVIGTSAGAIVGCQLAGGSSIQLMLEGQIARARHQHHASNGPRKSAKDPAAFLDELASAGPAQICARALKAESAVPEDIFVANFDGIVSHEVTWPEGFVCVATDAHTAERRVWDASSGVDLVRAVASSCCAPYVAQPVTLDGGRFVDGGHIR